MEKLTSIIESILFVSGDAVAISDISDKLEITDKEVLAAAKQLQEKYNDESGINLLIFNKKLQFCSNSKYAEEVSSVLNPIKERELSRSMLEVAAIIAYKQPVTRLDLEELRGTNSEYAISNLLKLGMIEVVGRKDTVGKPVLFGTTDEFLKRFQISSISDLPDYNELMEKITQMRSPANDSSYLFTKDVYVESEENPIEVEIEKASAVNEVENEPDADDVDIVDLEDEEIPDFLKDENIDVIE